MSDDNKTLIQNTDGYGLDQSRVRNLIIAFFVITAPGLILLILHHVFCLLTHRAMPPLALLIPHLLIFIVLGIFALVVYHLLTRFGSLEFAFICSFTIGLVLSLIVVMGTLGQFLFGSLSLSFNKFPFIISAACSGGMAAGVLWARRRNYSGLPLYFFGSFISVCLISWCIFLPEGVLLGHPYKYWLTAVSLSILILILYQVRLLMRLPAVIDLITMAAMFCLVFGLNFGGKWIQQHRSQERQALNEQPSSISGPKHTNILLIVWDTVRRDHLSLYGYQRATTPFLEELEEQSDVYTQIVSASPWTLPSHASIFTGLYPRSHGAHYFFNEEMSAQSKDYNGIPEELITLTELLKNNGYQTGGISANALLTRRNNFDQGFDYIFHEENPNSIQTRLFKLNNYVVNTLGPLLPKQFIFLYYNPWLNAEQVNSLALDWLDSIDPGKPFFLFLNYMDAHTPYYPPGHLAERYPGAQEKLAVKGVGEIWDEMLVQKRPIKESESRYLISQYDALLNYLDEQLRIFLNALEQQGRFEDTMIIITSDHGEFLGEHDLLGHHKHLYSGVLHVPLIIRHPGRNMPQEIDLLTDNRIIYYAILEQSGLELEKTDYPWAAFTELYRGKPQSLSNGEPIIYFSCDRKAVYFDNYKFITSNDGTSELYDMDSDPYELNNLLQIEPERARQGIRLIQNFTSAVYEWKDSGEIQQFTEEEIEKLKALGYIK